MSSQPATPQRRITAPDIAAKKGVEPIVSLTAYHSHTAALAGADADTGDDRDRVLAIRDVVALNAAAALVAYEAAVSGFTQGTLLERIGGQLPRTRAIIESGAALRVLETWVKVCNELTT